MKVLVTGSRGLIGTEVRRRLAEAGMEVVEFDSAHPATDPRHGDIGDLDRLRRRVAGCGGVLHLAAVSRVVFGERDPALCWEVNVEGTRNVIRACLERPAGRRPWMIYASSREVYGDAAALPVPEDAPLAPVNIYGRSKLAAEEAVAGARGAGLPTATVRFSNVFGSVEDHPDRVVPAFARAAATGGVIRVEGAANSFDFTHISDVGRGVAAVALRLTGGERSLPAIHFVSGRATTLGELARMARDAARSDVLVCEAPPRSFDVARFRGDPARAEGILGWRARISVEEGLRALIDDFARCNLAPRT